jgi:hypothetical protein
MHSPKMFICAICGQVRRHSSSWFLLCEDTWHDRLKILRWNEAVASQKGVRCACSIAHVRELVAHWIATGSLNYPFASASSFERWINQCLDRDFGESSASINIQSNIVGELAVDRESLRRTLRDGPQSLSSTIEALLRALVTESADADPVIEFEETLVV